MQTPTRAREAKHARASCAFAKARSRISSDSATSNARRENPSQGSAGTNMVYVLGFMTLSCLVGSGAELPLTVGCRPFSSVVFSFLGFSVHCSHGRVEQPFAGKWEGACTVRMLFCPARFEMEQLLTEYWHACHGWSTVEAAQGLAPAG